MVREQPFRGRLLPWLAAAVFGAGALVLLAGLLPAELMRELASRVGHADHLTPERAVRWRLVCLTLAGGHAVLGVLLRSLARSTAADALAVPQAAVRSTRPLAAIANAWHAIRQSGWLHAAALAIVLITGGGIRLRYLNVPMDYDEAYSFLNFARRPLWEGLSDYNTTNNHLLNTLAMHVANRLFGPQEWALRLHVLAAGVGLIVATYALARSLCNPHVGLVAAALVATADVLVNYSINARGYIWLPLATVLLLHAAWRLGDPVAPPLVRGWIVAWLAAVVGFFAAPIMIYPATGCFAWLVATFARRGALRQRLTGLGAWAAAVGLTSGWLYAPGLVVRGLEAWQHPFVSPHEFVDWMKLMPSAWLTAVASWTEGKPRLGDDPTVTVVGLLVCVAFALGLSIALTHPRAARALVAVPLATWWLMAVQRVAPPPRIFVFLAPLFFTVAGAGAAGVFRFRAWLFDPLQSRNLERLSTVATAILVLILSTSAAVRAASHPLPGGLSPVFLYEDEDVQRVAVERFGYDPVRASFRQKEDQGWRFAVEPAVRELEPELHAGDRVLVALPADLPFHFYAARRGWTVPVGGEPQPGERLFLVARRGPPRRALEDNLSLRKLATAAPWLLTADWQPWRQVGELAIWQARPAAASTDSESK